LHHEAQKVALTQNEQTLISDEKAFLSQADSKKAFGSTSFERKQMSTKTTLKRIALVAVSALGFGLLSSIAPANAASGSMTLSTSSLTVVGGTESSSGSGLFYVDVANTAGAYAGLASGESISVVVTGKPTFRSNLTTDAALTDVVVQAVTTSAGASFSNCGTAVAGSNQVPNGGGACASDNWDGADHTSARYWFAVYPNTTGVADAGAYTLRVRLFDSTGYVLQSSNLSVKFVTAAADSGAVIGITQTGIARTGSALSYTSTNKVAVTLADANSGKVVIGAATTAGLSGRAPQLAVALLSSASAVVSESGLSIDDNGTAGTDYVAGGTYETTYDSYSALSNGTYGVTDSSISATSSTVSYVRVRYGSTEKVGAFTILGTASAVDETKVDLTMTAAGLKVGEELAKSDVDTSTTYTLPLTTTSGSLKVNIDNSSNTAAANQSMRVKRVWSGNYVSADVTPASQSAATTEVTDASGNIVIPFTNASPLDGATLTITVEGFDASLAGYVNGKRTIVINWAKAAVDSIAILDPVSGIKVKAGGTTTFTVMVKDQFGNGMAGEKIQPSITTDTDNNYSATATLATVTTGAAGTATWSLTDAAAVAGYDHITFTTINGAKTTSQTLTYVTTLPVVATLRTFYNRDATTTSSGTWTLVPSTGIYDSASAKLTTTIARNYSRSLASLGAADGDDMVGYRVECLTSAGASATGAAVVVTAGTGGYIVGADNLKATSRTFSCTSGYVYFVGGATGTGTVTFTATAGSVTSSASQVMTNAAADARYITMTAAATTGTANGAAVPVTVAVTDRFGNPVSSVDMTLTATGAGVFSGGATTMTYKTDSTGTYTFQATSLTEAGGTGTFTATVTTSSDVSSVAGYTTATAVDSTLTAGVKTASAAITFAAGKSAATVAANAATEAANAAADAALEAIDAATAATDAANLAAEAADAATMAAQDAKDAADAATAAVEKLAQDVATMIDALKAQLATLANVVAKIAKKVKA